MRSQRVATAEGSTLGRTIRWLRKRRGLSQKEVAARAAVSQGYLSQLENEEVKNPSVHVLARIARALDVSPAELLQAAGMSLREDVPAAEGPYAVNVELLRLLSQLPPERQRRVLSLLLALDDVWQERG